MFLDKLKPFFKAGKRYLKNGAENEELKVEYANPQNEYYAKVSDRYGVLQILLFAALSVFLIVSLLINSEWVSYQNFYYFFSDFGNYMTTADSDIENVIYDTGNLSDYGLFGGKLAVAGKDGVELYTMSGRSVYKQDIDVLKNPKIEASERYMLVFDNGSREYRIYNMFTKIHSEITDKPIYGAASADNGNYALITKDDTHISCVKVYNRTFDEIQTIGRASYVNDVSLTPTGDRVAVLSYSRNGGDFDTHLLLCLTSKNREYADITVNGTFPLYCSLTEKGCAVAVCDDRILSYNTYGKQVEEFRFPDNTTILDVECNRYGCVVISKEIGIGGTNVTVFNANGKLVLNNRSENDYSSVSLLGGTVFAKGADKIYRISNNGERTDTATYTVNGDAVMLIRNENEVLLCTNSHVETVKFD